MQHPCLFFQDRGKSKVQLSVPMTVFGVSIKNMNEGIDAYRSFNDPITKAYNSKVESSQKQENLEHTAQPAGSSAG